MRRVTMLLAALAIGACGQDDTSTEPVEQASASCPVVGEDGQIAIADGLNATILRNGYGRAAVMGDDVVVKAKLWVYDDTAEGGKGTFVWESGPHGFAFQIGADGFIDGWSPGVACMLLGEKRELIIATELAYGEKGRGPIPPNADIIYDLELISIVEPEQESSD